MAFPTEKASDNDYRLLGLSPAASQTEVKKAYRDLVKRWHPDFFQQRPLFERKRAEERFKEITGAYRRISLGWKSQATADQSSRTPTTKEEPKAGPEAKSSTQASAASSSSHNRYRFRQPHRRPSGSSPSQNLDFRSFAQFVTDRIGRKHLKWDQRSVGVLLFVILFLIIFGITSIPVHTWFTHRQESHAPEIVPPPQEIVPDQPSDIPQPESAFPTPETGASQNHFMPSRPQSPPPIPPQGRATLHFTLGSTQSDVLRVQGTPSRIYGQTWIYGLSEIQFKEGRVWRYNNFDGSLNIQIPPMTAPTGEKPSFLTLGSNKNDILLVQGTPTRVESNKWFYGFSEIRFKNELVEEYDNYFGNLNIRLLPSSPSLTALQKGFFTIGSTMDDVLTIQGTPTSIQGNYWFYQLSSILFRDKKVQYVFNSGGNLHFVPPEEPAK